MASGATPAEEASARLASGAQFWRLNKLGLLGEALTVEERISADRAREMLWDAASRGLWEPRPRRQVPVGMKALPTYERIRLQQARGARSRAADDDARGQ
jgi:hypothetical protein